MKRNFLYFMFFAFTVSTRSLAQEIILSDQIFNINVVEKNVGGRNENMPLDELVINANKISATFSTKNGFPAVTYNVTEAGAPTVGTYIISAQSAKDKNHILKWTVTLKGNSVTGKAEHFFLGKLGGEYDFTGTLKKKK